MITKRCEICGREFEARNDRYKLCSDLCRKLHRSAYLSVYRSEHKEYNREWMRKYREMIGKEERNRKRREAKAKKKGPVNTFEGLNYAERQKQKTLEMVGRVQICGLNSETEVSK